MKDTSGSLGVCKWWRFCDVSPNPPGMKMEYRFQAGSPSLDPNPVDPSAPSTSGSAVTFKVRRLVPPDKAQADDKTDTVDGKVHIVVDEQTFSPEVRLSNPWDWQFEYTFNGGKGIVEVTTMVDGATKLTETFPTGVAVNQK